MSILKKLKKKQSRKSETVLQSGIVLLLETQEDFNNLASLFDSVHEDTISIDGIYIAYMDEYPALQVEPIENFCEDIDNFLESCSHKSLKPIDFKVWYKKNK